MISRLERGEGRARAASYAWTSIAWPMLTGTLITAALWNNLGDNFDYTVPGEGLPTNFAAVTLKADTTNPSVGAGSAKGEGWHIGNLVIVRYVITFGAGATAGSGNFYIDMPTEMDDTNITGAQIVGNGWIYDASATTGYSIAVRRDASADDFRFLTTGGLFVDHNSPFTWASGDRLEFQAIYPAASQPA